MSSVFIRVRERQFGPFSEQELKTLVARGEFSSTDLVYDELSADWVRAENLEELKKIFPTTTSAEKVNHERRVVAIGGGKGGVGKTVLTASMGIGLAALGNKVVLVDADLGGANLHTCMGILEPEYTFYDFYTMQRESLNDIALPTPVENLQLISGACGTLGLANPRFSQKVRFIRELKEIDADYILLDLGAGASYNVIDFFISADECIVVTSPDPMAIQETFNFIKISLLRKLRLEFRDHPEIMAILEQESLSRAGRMEYNIEKYLNEAYQVDKKAGEKWEQILATFRPKLILNMVFESREIKEGNALQLAVKDMLNIDLEYWGYIEYDGNVRTAVKELRPFIVANPKSRASRFLARIITLKMLGSKGLAGYRQKLKLTRTMKSKSGAYPAVDLHDSSTICSVRCFYWDDCEYQNGGFPCAVRHLEPIFKK